MPKSIGMFMFIFITMNAHITALVLDIHISKVIR